MDKILDFIINNWVSLSTTIGLITAYFVDKKKKAIELSKSKEEVKITKADAIKGMQDAYDKMVEDVNNSLVNMKKDLENVNNQKSKLEEDILKLQKVIEDNKIIICKLNKTIVSYQKEIDIYQLQVKNLTEEIKTYRGSLSKK